MTQTKPPCLSQQQRDHIMTEIQYHATNLRGLLSGIEMLVDSLCRSFPKFAENEAIAAMVAVGQDEVQRIDTIAGQLCAPEVTDAAA